MKTKASGAPSRLLETKDEAGILVPAARPFEWNGRTHEIYPMPDRVLMTLGTEIAAILTLFDGLGEIDFASMNRTGVLSTIAPITPKIIDLLVPAATRIISGCLRVPEADVADNMRIAKKLEALRLIVESEDWPAILGEVNAIRNLFGQISTKIASRAAESTNSSLPTTTGPRTTA